MNSWFHVFKLVAASLLLGFVAACGSGGGGGTDTPVLPPAVPAPVITAAPAAASVVAPGNAVFTVIADGTGLTYQWYRNDIAIAGATAASYSFATAATDNGAKFRVQVSNSAGSVTSAPVNLAVAAANAAPAISSPPASVTAGELTATQFSVAAVGSGTLSYQWFKNGVAIAGATQSTYAVPRIDVLLPAGTAGPAAVATYTATVSNSFGSSPMSAPATLTVERSKPVILVQPVDATVQSGKTPADYPTFNVQFSGSPALTFQWQRNGVDIPDTLLTVTAPTGQFTYSIRLFDFVADKNAVYTLRIKNDLGEAVSTPAKVIITP